jgi:hypothetical protein
METNELEEMKAQLAVLNEKLESEPIVSEAMLSNATKKSMTNMQRKLLIRIIVAAVLAYFVYGFFGCWFLEWLLGTMVLNVYVLLKTRKTLTKPLDVAEYTKQMHKVIKIFRWGRLILFVFFSLWLVYVGILNLVHFWPTGKGTGILILCICIITDIVVATFYYVIDEVFVKPDVEITLEGVLKDLES